MAQRVGSLSPSWLAPVVAVAAVVVGSLSAVVERGGLQGVDDSNRVAPLSLALIAVTVAAWLIETYGVAWPRLVFVATVVLPVAWFVYVGRNTAAPMFLLLLVGWGAYNWTRRQAIIVLVASLLSVLLPLPWGADPILDWIPWLFGITLAWLSMLAVGTQQRLVAELHAAQADLARRSAAQERQRIAREVHDVIVHTMSITLLHLTGARHILHRDPERAADALAQAERLGRQSLADIRRTVGLLDAAEGSPGAESGEAPLPGVPDLPELIASYARAGLTVRFTVDGDPQRPSASIGLDLYRIAQEALTNVVKHAPGAAVEITLTITDREARLRVQDDGPREGMQAMAPADGSGLGLPGMYERTALLNGTLVAGREGDGWLVECTAPLDRANANLAV